MSYHRYVDYDLGMMPGCCGAMLFRDFRLKKNYHYKIALKSPMSALQYRKLDAELMKNVKDEGRTRAIITAVIPDKIVTNGAACAQYGTSRTSHTKFSIYNLTKYCEGWHISEPFVNKKTSNQVVIMWKDVDDAQEAV